MQDFTESMAAQVVRPRNNANYKGQNGRIVIVAGNERFGGAAIMSAQAAVYAGAGLVTVATAAKNHAPLHARLPEAMVIDWADANLPILLRQADVIVVGPGLGGDAAALGILSLVLSAVTDSAALIIDGSAITLIAENHIKVLHQHTIWTPHPIELQRLVQLAPPAQTDIVLPVVAHDQLPGILVAKGAPTRTIADHAAFRNTSGGPAMATGGTGDTLTGVIAAFCGQFGFNVRVVAAAVWTHSAAADLLAADQYVAVPSQVAAAVPKIMRRLSQQ